MATRKKDKIAQLKIDLLIKLGKRIKELREEKNLSQVDVVVNVIGEIDTTNISRLETGKTNPTFFTLYRIAKAMDVPLSELLNFDEK